jgi:hypothetical protein
MRRDRPVYCRTFQDNLLSIGVPAELVPCRLNSFSEGIEVENWLRAEGYRSLMRGENWFFETVTTEGIKALPLTAKALYSNKVDVRFERLGQLRRLLEERKFKEFDIVTSSRLLIIGDFFEPSKGPRECPLSTSQRGHIETMLLDRRDDRRATIFQIHNPYRLLLNYIDWWRSSVFDQLKPKRLKIEPAAELARASS